MYAVAMMPLPIQGVAYKVAVGLFSNDTTGSATTIRSTVTGSGIPKMPAFSQKPAGTPGGVDLYVVNSGRGGSDTTILTTKDLPDSALKNLLTMTGPAAQVIHWEDQRVEKPE